MWQEQSEDQSLWRTLRAAGRTSADQVLAAVDMRFPPVHVEEIAERLGIRVHRVRSPGWSGAVNSQGDRAEVWVAEEEAPVRQRFTIAHEIGHLLLHPVGVAYRDTSFKGTTEEVQANRFAAALLMPEWMLRPAVSITGTDVQRLAAMFEVSEQAMALRLEDLGVRL